MNIKQFSEQEQVEVKAKHELANPQPWAVMDGGIVYAWYATEEEAKVGLREANIEESVYGEFEEWVILTAEKYGRTEDDIKAMIS